MMTGRVLWACVALFGAGAARASAQDSVIVIRPKEAGDTLGVSGPPAEVVRELLAIYNDTSTARLAGSFTLPVGARLQGPVALSDNDFNPEKLWKR